MVDVFETQAPHPSQHHQFNTASQSTKFSFRSRFYLKMKLNALLQAALAGFAAAIDEPEGHEYHRHHGDSEFSFEPPVCRCSLKDETDD